jgi:hypothetical protein
LKAVLEFIKGNNRSLGGILPLHLRMIDRPLKIYQTFQDTILPKPAWLSFFSFLLMILINLKNKTSVFMKKFGLVSLIYTLSIIVTSVAFSPEFKGFYLHGFFIIFIIVLANCLNILWSNKIIYYRFFVAGFIILAIFNNINPLDFYKTVKTSFAQSLTITGIYHNQISVIDWMYLKSNGAGFKVYTYQGAVYDYPYQYLYTTYALKKYQYLPEDFSYLPDKPEYVPNKSLLLQKLASNIKPAQNNLYLIIEPDKYQSRIDEWKTNFPLDKYPLVDQLTLPDKTVVERRKIL